MSKLSERRDPNAQNEKGWHFLDTFNSLAHPTWDFELFKQPLYTINHCQNFYENKIAIEKHSI